MQIEKKELPKSQIELAVELTADEFKPHIEKAARKISQDIKIDGFRPGTAPFEIIKQKVGEMAILEEAARYAINDSMTEIIKNDEALDPVGQPNVDITKLAPGNPLGFKAILSVMPSIVLGEYKTAEIKPEKIQVKDEEVGKALAEIVETRVQEKIADRPVADSDKALVDIQMFQDNVPLEGGQARSAAVVIGKDYIVPGFDKALLGAKKGDVREFKLPYPKEHYMKNIAGKIVDFKVTVKDVYERTVPEINDEFAKNFGLKNADELKKNVKKSIEEHKTREADAKTERKMLDSILDKCRFGDIPDTLITHEGNKMMMELEQTIADQGGKFEDYLSSIGKTHAELTLDLLPDAVKRVKASLLIREIAKKENIHAEEKDVDKQISDLADYYQQKHHGHDHAADDKSMQKHLKSPEYRAYVSNILNTRKVVDQLKEWNIVK